jgi:ATP-dependent DNA ligase
VAYRGRIGRLLRPALGFSRLIEPLLANKPGLQFNGHDTGDGELILEHVGKLGFEGAVSKTIEAAYALGNRGLWRKAKWLKRQEFVAGWSDPEGSRAHLGALLLGYYSDDGKLTYAGRVGTGMPVRVLADLRRRLDPLARRTSPLTSRHHAQPGSARRSQSGEVSSEVGVSIASAPVRFHLALRVTTNKSDGSQFAERVSVL